MSIDRVATLVFDVFGTVVDWRGSIIADLSRWGEERGIEVDWVAFVDEWKTAYRPGMDAVNSGARPWMTVGQIYREKLDEMLPRYGLGELPDLEQRFIRTTWYRLQPWSDSVAGLERLSKRFSLCTLSNSDFFGMAVMSKRAKLPWDCILTAENAKRFKPDPAMYDMAIELLSRGDPGRLMMVAAHNYDLLHAKSHGMQTAFVRRPTEYGPQQKTDLEAEAAWELTASSIEDLAKLLGC